MLRSLSDWKSSSRAAASLRLLATHSGKQMGPGQQRQLTGVTAYEILSWFKPQQGLPSARCVRGGGDPAVKCAPTMPCAYAIASLCRVALPRLFTATAFSMHKSRLSGVSSRPTCLWVLLTLPRSWPGPPSPGPEPVPCQPGASPEHR